MLTYLVGGGVSREFRSIDKAQGTAYGGLDSGDLSVGDCDS